MATSKSSKSPNTNANSNPITNVSTAFWAMIEVIGHAVDRIVSLPGKPDTAKQTKVYTPTTEHWLAYKGHSLFGFCPELQEFLDNLEIEPGEHRRVVVPGRIMNAQKAFMKAKLEQMSQPESKFMGNYNAFCGLAKFAANSKVEPLYVLTVGKVGNKKTDPKGEVAFV